MHVYIYTHKHTSMLAKNNMRGRRTNAARTHRHRHTYRGHEGSVLSNVDRPAFLKCLILRNHAHCTHQSPASSSYPQI